MAAVTDVDWIELDGAVNVRDLGGLPTTDGRRTRSGVLIRSDNLQDLTDADLVTLVERRGVRAVADLRTGVEVASTGPNRLHDDPRVDVRHLSLFPEAGTVTDVTAIDHRDGSPVLPWQDSTRETRRGQGAGAVYLGYLTDRPDSVLAAVRMVAHTPGATVVHCAAGKDRTGVVVALTLEAAGVERAAVVADYTLSAERIAAILSRLRNSATYRADVGDSPPERHAPRQETMYAFLDGVDARYGSAEGFLRAHGWTGADQAALLAHLLV